MANLFYIGLVPYGLYLLAMAICVLAVWKGDRPLRLAAAILFVSWMLSALPRGRDMNGMNYPITVIDATCCVAFVWISVRWRKIWCAVLAALMIIETSIPFVTFFSGDIRRYNQIASHNIVTVMPLAVLVVAIWLAVRDRKRIDAAVPPV
ncbi:hypothetical protein [Caulobacter sp.]|uniref:hypothetical protein n=1 Tax=Caulobacter sp. TaxID=78 RepID=UPI001B1F197E|nr:hypothetical protein [Caulobacter sp.]MBO9545201.1 hypothetical protein [Caulobacter sp.]